MEWLAYNQLHHLCLREQKHFQTLKLTPRIFQHCTENTRFLRNENRSEGNRIVKPRSSFAERGYSEALVCLGFFMPICVCVSEPNISILHHSTSILTGPKGRDHHILKTMIAFWVRVGREASEVFSSDKKLRKSNWV